MNVIHYFTNYCQMLQDFSKSLRLALRVWRAVQANKRSGVAFNITDVLERVRRYTVATRCPACPQPSVNMDIDLADVPIDER